MTYRNGRLELEDKVAQRRLDYVATFATYDEAFAWIMFWDSRAERHVIHDDFGAGVFAIVRV